MRFLSVEAVLIQSCSVVRLYFLCNLFGLCLFRTTKPHTSKTPFCLNILLDKASETEKSRAFNPGVRYYNKLAVVLDLHWPSEQLSRFRLNTAIELDLSESNILAIRCGKVVWKNLRKQLLVNGNSLYDFSMCSGVTCGKDVNS